MNNDKAEIVSRIMSIRNGMTSNADAEALIRDALDARQTSPVTETAMPVKYWTMKSAIEQIQKCSFECEGGSIENNDAWRWIVQAAKIGPEFWPGQGISFEIEAEAAGKRPTELKPLWIL